MKIIDAFWEKRNVGLSCIEVTVDDGDACGAVEKTLTTLDAEYLVAKLPVARYDLMKTAERAGFSFIEASMNVVHHLQNIEPRGLMKRLNDSISYEEMTGPDAERMYEEIRNGMFVTDRVYLDDFFSKEQAAQRYVYWIADAVNRGGQLYKVVYKDTAIGFFIFEETTQGRCYPFLSGLYKAATSPGMGNVVLHKIIEEASRRGLKLISSFISTNNMPVIKIHISEGFTISGISYVYIKHKNGQR